MIAEQFKKPWNFPAQHALNAALAVVVLVATAGGVWTRVRNLLIGLAAMIASAGWYLLLVQRWPADARPYIGGSTDNSLLELAIGYNGLGRVLGGSGNPTRTPGGSGGPGGPGGAAFGGDPGFTRMFGEAFGTEISWLLPAAVIVGAIALPLFILFGPEALEHRLSHSGASALVSTRAASRRASARAEAA